MRNINIVLFFLIKTQLAITPANIIKTLANPVINHTIVVQHIILTNTSQSKQKQLGNHHPPPNEYILLQDDPSKRNYYPSISHNFSNPITTPFLYPPLESQFKSYQIQKKINKDQLNILIEIHVIHKILKTNYSYQELYQNDRLNETIFQAQLNHTSFPDTTILYKFLDEEILIDPHVAQIVEKIEKNPFLLLYEQKLRDFKEVIENFQILDLSLQKFVSRDMEKIQIQILKESSKFESFWLGNESVLNWESITFQRNLELSLGFTWGIQKQAQIYLVVLAKIALIIFMGFWGYSFIKYGLQWGSKKMI